MERISQDALFFATFIVLSGGAFLTAITSPLRRLTAWLGFILVLIGSTLCLIMAANALYALTVEVGRSYFLVPVLNASLQIRVDALSAFFLLIIGLLSICTALYSVSYIVQKHYAQEHLIRYYPFLLLFIAGMIGVVVSWDMFYFLVFWEVMALASYALVIFEKRNPIALRAGLKYFVMTHIGTTFIIAGFVVVWLWSRSFNFDALRNGMEVLASERPRLLHLVLLLLFVGLATKAALFPFGDWLPDAHPAAPSPISSLLSGVMIKMGIYGMLRAFVWMMPPSYHLSVWGLIIALFGVISAFICSTTGLFQNDSKRLLAFSSISQIGYISLGMGVGIGFMRVSPAISTLGFIAALYHVLNHACMKGLLFLNAGSVLTCTGTRDMNILGGLWRFMPTTAVTALVASLAISGIPPFNGFVSKWMIYHASIMSGLRVPVYLAFGVVAMFISVVTLAMFIKFMGTIFTGLPSKLVSQLEGELREVDWTMTVPQVFLALMCIILGLFPYQVVQLAHRAVEAMRPEFVPSLDSLFCGMPITLGTCVGEGISGVFSPLIYLVSLILCTLIPYMLYKLSGAQVRVTTPWACGEVHPQEELRYRAGGFFLPFRAFLSFRVGQKRITSLYPTLPKPKAPWLVKLSALFNVDRLYEAVIGFGAKACEWFSATHAGVPQLYVLWMAAGVVLAVLLLYLLS